MNTLSQYKILNLDQKNEPSDSALADRLRNLIHRRRWKLPEAARLMGVSESYVSHLQNGNRAFSAERRARLEALEKDYALQKNELGEGLTIALGEDQAPYAPPPPSPTEQEVVDYFLAALTEARQLPGGVGYVATILKMHLNPEQIKKLKG